MERPLKISVIIPAFNEERHIGPCLDALMAQSIPADEIIVVDNNSTDATAQIVRHYPGVTLLLEPQQGQVQALNTGLAAASGDILARIDADARALPDWVERLHAWYADADVMAVGGAAIADNVPYVGWGTSTLWSRGYLWCASWFFNVPILWGANMSLRRSAWQKIAAEHQSDSDFVHEDQDVSLLLAKYHMQAVADSHLLVHVTPVAQKYWPYMAKLWRTYSLHRRNGTLHHAKRLYAPAQRFALGLGCVVPMKLAAVMLLSIGLTAYAVAKVVRSATHALRWQATTD